MLLCKFWRFLFIISSDSFVPFSPLVHLVYLIVNLWDFLFFDWFAVLSVSEVQDLPLHMLFPCTPTIRTLTAQHPCPLPRSSFFFPLWSSDCLVSIDVPSLFPCSSFFPSLYCWISPVDFSCDVLPFVSLFCKFSVGIFCLTLYHLLSPTLHWASSSSSCVCSHHPELTTYISFQLALQAGLVAPPPIRVRWGLSLFLSVSDNCLL